MRLGTDTHMKATSCYAELVQTYAGESDPCPLAK